MQPDTIINLVAGGALAAFLARLLQQQYEARIADYKDRITEQSGLLHELGGGLEKLTDEVERLQRLVDARQAGQGG